MVTALSAEYGSTGYGCQSRSWSAEQGNFFFLCPRLHLRIWSRETGSAVPSRVSLPILHTQAESGAYSMNSSRFPRRNPHVYTVNRHRASPEFFGLRTDGFHCRESTGAGPEVLKLVPVILTGAAFSGFTVDQLLTHLFPTPTIGCSGYINSHSMCDKERSRGGGTLDYFYTEILYLHNKYSVESSAQN